MRPRPFKPWHTNLPPQGPFNPYRTWLETQGSLTRRLQRTCTDFRVERLWQGLDRPVRDEVSGDNHERAWVREVLLRCDGNAVVFAHSVLDRRPRHPLDRLFRGLGNRALGSLLFTDPRFHRHALEFLELDARHPLFRRVSRLSAVSGTDLPGRLWARRACFEWGGKTLRVTEVFLPAVLRRTKTITPPSLTDNASARPVIPRTQ